MATALCTSPAGEGLVLSKMRGSAVEGRSVDKSVRRSLCLELELGYLRWRVLVVRAGFPRDFRCVPYGCGGGRCADQ